MPVALNFDKSTRHAHVSVSGRFVFDYFTDFLSAVTAHSETARSMCIDLSGVHYLDTSALGMLLQARKKMYGKSMSLRMVPESHVHDVLAIVNFDQLFDFEFA